MFDPQKPNIEGSITKSFYDFILRLLILMIQYIVNCLALAQCSSEATKKITAAAQRMSRRCCSLCILRLPLYLG